MQVDFIVKLEQAKGVDEVDDCLMRIDSSPSIQQVQGDFVPLEPGDVGVLTIRSGKGKEGCKEDGVVHYFGGGSVKF